MSTHLSTASTGGQSPELPQGWQGVGSRRCPCWASPRGTRPAQLGTDSPVGWELLPAPAREVPAIGAWHRDFTPSAVLKERKKGGKKIYILTVTHHLPFWNLWGWCNLHKAVQKSKTILNNRGRKKKFAADG